MISAFQYFRLSAMQGPAPRPGSRNLARLLGLDGPPVGRPRLACRWNRDPDGRLSCIWEEHLRATLSDSG